MQRTAEPVSCRLTVGGGVRALDDIRKLCCQAPTRCRSIPRLSAIVISCDRRRKIRRAMRCRWRSMPRPQAQENGNSTPMADGGPTGMTRSPIAREVVSLGAGELLLTSMDRDGTGRVSTRTDPAVSRCGERSGDRLGWSRHLDHWLRHSRWPCRGRPRRLDPSLRHLLNREAKRHLSAMASPCACVRNCT